MPKIIIHIGRNIQTQSALALLSPLMYFPECTANGGEDCRLPQHSQDTADQVLAAFKERAADMDESEPLHVVTHAQCVVTVAGELVGNRELDADQVAIVMHGREPGDVEETTYHFDAQGVLSDGWPFGWFEWS